MKAEWVSKKPPVYCRAHGRRIIIFLNGLGGCRKCADDLILAMKKRKDLTNPCA